MTTLEAEMDIKVTIIGPLNVDYKTSIDVFPDDVLEVFPTPYVKRPISKAVGGKGYLAAKAVLDLGASPYLVACIGGGDIPDQDGCYLLSAIKSENIQGDIRTQSGYNTAQVLLVYFKDNNPRLMVCDNDVIFQLNFMQNEINYIIDKSQMIYVSGYLLLEEPSRSSVTWLLETAKKNNVYALLDIVPHSITDHIEKKVILGASRNADVLVVAPATLDNIFPNAGLLSATTHKQLLPYFQQLGIGHLLAILDKINGILVLCTEQEAKIIDLGDFDAQAPASGAGEYEMLRICLNHLSGGGKNAVH